MTLAEALIDNERLRRENDFMAKVIERLTGRSHIRLTIDEKHVYDFDNRTLEPVRLT